MHQPGHNPHPPKEDLKDRAPYFRAPCFIEYFTRQNISVLFPSAPPHPPPVCRCPSLVDSVSSLYILLRFPYPSAHKGCVIWAELAWLMQILTRTKIFHVFARHSQWSQSPGAREETLPQLLIHTQTRKMPYVGVTWHPPNPMICASYSGAVPTQRARARVQALPLGDVGEPWIVHVLRDPAHGAPSSCAR